MNYRFLLLLLILTMISSCAKDEEDIFSEPELSEYEINVIDYFKETDSLKTNLDGRFRVEN